LFPAYKKINPDVKVYSVDLKGYRSTVFTGDVVQLSGWSEKIFDIIKMTEIDKNALVNTIKNYEIG